MKAPRDLFTTHTGIQPILAQFAAHLGISDADNFDRYKDEAALLADSLGDFQRAAWHLVEPTTPYVHNWHIDCIAEHLEAISHGHLQNLVINIPPRHEKSLNVAVFWPCWVWATQPSFRWLFSSYSSQLSMRDSVKCRRIIQSAWYQQRWGHVFRLTTDQNVKHRFENDCTGVRLATSVGGIGTGEGGDVIVVDDPHNVKDGESELRREEVLRWWDEAMTTRLNDPTKGAKVIVMQRVHERDLTGHVLEQGGYHHLCLPARWEPTVQIETGIGWTDPRVEEGQLLWPERFPEYVMDDMERAMGPYAAAGQLQQRPSPRKGGMFDSSDFKIVEQMPPGMEYWVRYWDKAGTAGGGAHTAGVLMGCTDTEPPTYVVADVARGQWAANDREDRIKSIAWADVQRLGGIEEVLFVVEQEPGSGGKESAEHTIDNLDGLRVEAHRPTGDKFVRADPLAGTTKAGRVCVLRGEWNEPYLREMDHAGPGARYLDQMDASAGAFAKLNEQRRRSVVSVAPQGMTKASYWRGG